MSIRAIFYIDGFNLYHRAIQTRARQPNGPKLHWLDIGALCHKLLPRSEIASIKYFTANISAYPNDLDKPVRQQIYLRALRTIPNLEVIHGHFQSNPRKQPVHYCPAEKPEWVTVTRTDEKGSDVNLASCLLRDAFTDRFDVAAVVSADSDLVLPIRIAREEVGKAVWVFSPRKKATRALQAVATQYRTIRVGALRGSQFPLSLSDANGTFSCPEKWQSQS